MVEAMTRVKCFGARVAPLPGGREFNLLRRFIEARPKMEPAMKAKLNLLANAFKVEHLHSRYGINLFSTEEISAMRKTMVEKVLPAIRAHGLYADDLRDVLATAAKVFGLKGKERSSVATRRPREELVPVRATTDDKLIEELQIVD